MPTKIPAVLGKQDVSVEMEDDEGGPMSFADVDADLKTRTIFLSGDITETTWHSFLVVYRELCATKKPITVILNSGGGVESSGYAIYDLIRLSGVPTDIYVYGGAFSIAAAILQAGRVRAMSPQSRFMIHNGTGCIGRVDFGAMASLGERVCRNLSQYHSVLMERATITLEELVTLCNKEMFLTPEESIKMGFVDCIIGETPKTKVTKKGPRK